MVSIDNETMVSQLPYSHSAEDAFFEELDEDHDISVKESESDWNVNKKRKLP